MPAKNRLFVALSLLFVTAAHAEEAVLEEVVVSA